MTKKQTFIGGVLIMLISQIIIKILGFLYRVIITNINGFGDAGNSLYSTGYKVYLVLLAISTTGIPAALAKLVSEKAAIGDFKGAHRMFKVGFYLFSGIGLAGTLLLLLTAKSVAVLIGNPEADLVMYVLAPSVLFVAVAAVFRGYFQGLYDMKAQGSSQVIDQLAKAVFTILFVYMFMVMGQNTRIMAAGATLGTTIGTIASAIYLWVYYNRRKKDLWEGIRNQEIIRKKDSSKDIVKRLIKLAIPISMGSIILTIAGIVDLATVINRLQQSGVDAKTAKALYGILTGKGDVLVNFPLALNIAFATALVPAVASSMALKDTKTAANRIAFSLKATILIGLPSSIGLFVLADPIVLTLFPNAPQGGYLVALSALSVIFIALSQTLSGALQGLGRVIVPASALMIGALVKLCLNYILIPMPQFGIKGAAISSIVCYFIAASISIIALLRKIKIKLGFADYILKPVIASVGMGLAAFYTFKGISLYVHSAALSTIASIGVAAVVYILLLIAVKALDKEDYKMLPYGDKMYGFLNKHRLI
ncbi:MAG: putative polysaccharide biosynthesis protein [Deltaproteobacteria bacterium]